MSVALLCARVLQFKMAGNLRDILCRRVARIFRGGGGGGVRVASEDANLYGGPGACSPRKILKFWIALDYISHVFIVEKERKRM